MKSLIVALTILAAAPAHAGLPNPLTPFTAPTKGVPGGGLVTVVKTISLKDLQTALASANAQTILPQGVTQPAPFDATVTGGDTRHGNCWAALIKFANNVAANNLLPGSLGIATAMQTIFNDQQLVGRPLIPDYVATNCVLAFNDAGQDLSVIITGLGLKAITLPKL